MLIDTSEVYDTQQAVVSSIFSQSGSKNCNGLRDSSTVMALKLDANTAVNVASDPTVPVDSSYNSPAASISDDTDSIIRSCSDSDFETSVPVVKESPETDDLAEEPLLVENPHRFVLFPIKDEEVRYASHFY